MRSSNSRIRILRGFIFVSDQILELRFTFNEFKNNKNQMFGSMLMCRFTFSWDEVKMNYNYLTVKDNRISTTMTTN